MKPLIISRQTSPTKYDTAPMHTQCTTNENPEIVWIQMSRDEHHPEWVSFLKENIPPFLEKTFRI
jgi:hypothetical protein